MAQPNSQYGDSIYFPYAAGSLIAYAFDDAKICSEYLFKSFIYKKDDIHFAVSGVDKPFLVGFSCYVWNYEYNKALAKAFKAAYPGCITVFGGHQINSESDVIGSDYADYIIVGEGEESFKQLLLALADDGDVKDVPNLIYKSNGKPIRTQKTDIMIADRVSPYLCGLFDEIVESEPLQFSAIIETNRGCPNRCAFCDWGNIKSKIKNYPLETVFAEIDWMAEHKIDYCYCADSNFGLFGRDEQIIEYIIKKHNETGFPEKFQATYSKNNPETVFKINKRLNDVGMCKGATLSFQSLSDKVLENIYRKNMPLESFRRLMTMYNENNIAAYSEIILGLPGETYESFRDGMEQLLEYGQHMSINVFNCEMLKNSIMSDPGYVKKFGIETVRTEQHQYHIHHNQKNIKEYSEIVVSTSTMSKEMWVKSNVIASFIRAFHNLGLLQCFAIYLYYEKGVKYSDFYESLIDWSDENKDFLCGRVLGWLRSKYVEVLSGDGALTDFESDFGEITWPLDESAFLRVIREYDLFYDEIKPFLRRYIPEEDLFDDLTLYQRYIVKTPYSKGAELKLRYDLFSYFSDIYINKYHALKERKNTIYIDAGNVPQNLPDYARETVWFGRKGGQNIITDVTYLKER